MRRKAGDIGIHSPGGLWSGDYSVLILKVLLPPHLYNVSLKMTDCSLRETHYGLPSAASVYPVELSQVRTRSLLSTFLFYRSRL